MPYGIILALASIVLAVRYAIDAEASVYGRLAAIAATVVSFVLPGSAVGQVATVLLQLSVSLFVLVRMKLLAVGR